MGFGAGAQQSWQSQSLELLLALAGLSQCCREDQGPLLTFTALHVGRKEMRPWKMQKPSSERESEGAEALSRRRLCAAEPSGSATSCPDAASC